MKFNISIKAHLLWQRWCGQNNGAIPLNLFVGGQSYINWLEEIILKLSNISAEVINLPRNGGSAL